MDNDSKFALGAKLISNHLKQDALVIYKDLFNNGYNDYNIGLWLLGEVHDIYAKEVFYKLFQKYQDDKDKMEKIKSICYPKFLWSKDKYYLTIDEMEIFEKDYAILLSDPEFLKKNHVGFFIFNIFSKIDNLHNIKYCIPKEEVEKHRTDVFNVMNKNKKIAFLCIGNNVSPLFNLFKDVLFYLSKINKNIILYLDNTEDELDEYSKNRIKGLTIYYVKNLNDNDLYEKIKVDNIDILITMYAHYQRYNVLLRKPCKVMIRGLDGECNFPTYFFDYNIIHNISTIKNNKDFKYIILKNFMAIPKKNKFKITNKKPIYNKKKVKIGIITTSLKISKDLILLLKKILQHDQILLSIYTYMNKDYLYSLLETKDEKKLIITHYNNQTNKDLKSNVIYLDTFFFNNHSTALEILSSYRPIISYYNKDHYFGTLTYNMIKNLDMVKELSATNVNDYYNLVMKYVNSEKEYNKMFQKFKENVRKSKILDNEQYAKDFYKAIYSIKIPIINNTKIIQKNNNKKIIGYFHLCQKGDWKKSFDLIFLEIKKSGLYDHTDEIRVGIVNDECKIIDDERLNDPKIKIIFCKNSSEYERPTLLHMRKHANPNYLYYYLHSKGISRFGTIYEKNVIDWIYLMVYWNINKWKIAIEMLNKYDTYGCNKINFPHVHYSGNFWWSTGKYIKSLPEYIDNDYLSPEMWIGKKENKMFSIYNSNLNHYYNPIIKEKYYIPHDFNIESYYILNKDIQHLKYDELVNHYLHYGKYENKKYKKEIFSQ
jgi:hypothetical protein